MELKLNIEQKVVAKVESINKGNHFFNCNCLLVNGKQINIKFFDPKQEISVGQLYEFKVIIERKDEEEIISGLEANLANKVLDNEKLSEILPKFFQYAPIGLTQLKKEIEFYLSRIKNPILGKITRKIYNDNKDKFFLHPAGTRFHHAYLGGLAYHTITMLKMVRPFLENYKHLDKDLLYSGIILHDMSKLDEITGVEGEYTKAGLLLGHLVMQTVDIGKVASKYGYEDKEEVLLLKHIVISHHGQLQFGSAKKPMVPEALLIWYLDTIDSKFRALEEQLEKTKEGEFTTNIPALDKSRFYKKSFK